MKRTESGWMVAGMFSGIPKLYSGSFHRSKRETITFHLELGGTWKWFRKYGDRAVKVTVTYEYPEEVQEK
ncbi:MAG: hypothetical protein MUO24_02280 [Desulfobacterales bacterium]|nr:hypothetical protein [Desulfobacterales bacterium]